MDAGTSFSALPALSGPAGVPLGVGRPRLWLFIVFYAALFAVLLGFVATTSYARQERVSGELVPSGGLLGVTARRDGFVSRVYVSNGQRVAAGAPLVAMSVDTQLKDGQQVGNLLTAAADEKALALRQQQGASAEETRNALDDIALRRRTLEEQLRLIESSRNFAEERIAQAQARVSKSEPLAKKGYISGFQFQQYQDGLTNARIALTEIDQRRADSRRQLQQLGVEEHQLRAKALTAGAAAASARSDLLSARAAAMGQQELLLAAERGGRVTALRAKPGAPVKAGETLAVVLPADSRLQAQVWMPSRAIGFVRPGDPVKLMFDAFPFQIFGTTAGRVVEVSAAPIAGQPAAPGAPSEPLYSVLIELDRQSLGAYGRNWALVPGMKVDAVILLERRSVLQWLIDPFIAFGGRSGG